MAVNPNCDSGARAPEAHRIGRRGLLGWISSASLFGSAVLGALSTCAFLRPRVSSGPPPRFRIGKPDGFPPGARPVLDARRICVVRARDGLAAISTTCTHLGCSVVPDETGFACACHGSQFDQDGHVVSGPAPRPLPWYRLSLAPDGEIEVDQEAEVNPGSYLAL